MIRKALKVTVPVRARVITEARIGPTQGVQINPKDKPTKKPVQNPSPWPENCGTLFANKEKILSIYACTELDNIVKPRRAIIKIEKLRRMFGEILKTFTIVERKSVKKVKLEIKPVMVPICFLKLFLLETETDRTIGKTGKIHGERMVTIPAINE